jgi:hypothetical protein
VSFVFLSYAREDEKRIRRLYNNLAAAGFDPWMDREGIPMGEAWREAITKAIDRSDVFIACLSKSSVKEGGVLAEELDRALAIREKARGRKLLLIPLRLDETEPPAKLQAIQWVDFDNDDHWTRVAKAIEQRRAGRRRRTMWVGIAAAIVAIGVAFLVWRAVRGEGDGPRDVGVTVYRLREAQPGDPAWAVSGGQTAVRVDNAQLRIDDKVRIGILTAASGYLYVISQALAPNPAAPLLLIPDPAQPRDANYVRAGRYLWLPPPLENGTWRNFTLRSPGPQYRGERVHVLFSASRLVFKPPPSGKEQRLDEGFFYSLGRDFGVAPEIQQKADAGAPLTLDEATGSSKDFDIETASKVYRLPASKDKRPVMISFDLSVQP